MGKDDVPSVADKFVDKAVKGGTTRCKAATIYSQDAILFDQVEKQKLDFAATWAYVPETDPALPDSTLSLHVYFHGNSNYVTVDPATGKCTKPDWMPGPMGVPCSVESARLAESAEDHHKPVVLAPEDAATDRLHTAHGKLRATAANSSAPVDSALGAFVEACFRQLAALDKDAGCPGSKKYLARNPSLTEIKRLFLCGHSGGGNPLSAASRADLVVNTPTDLGLLDCTYGWGNTEYVDFCTDKTSKGKMGLAAGERRLLCFYTPAEGDTEDSYTQARLKEEPIKKANRDKEIDAWEQKHATDPDNKKLGKRPDPYVEKTEAQIRNEWPNITMHNARDIILKGLVNAKFSLASPANLQPLKAKPATGWPAADMVHLSTADFTLIEDALNTFPILFVEVRGVKHDDFPNRLIPLILKTAKVT